jgi:light-regulated signal transduction histidine kinase (bacteriophytochrome)
MLMVNVNVDEFPDLSICDREAITKYDRIQSFGFLVALSNDWTIARVSENTEEMLGIPAEDMIGTRLDTWITPQSTNDIRNRMAALQATGNERMYDVALVPSKGSFDLSLHFVEDLLIIEGETCITQDRMEAASMVRAMISRLGRMETIEAFHNDAVRQIRAITGFDRVMVYQFDQNGDGDVIAESTRSNIESFLGLRYPASDIPQQARALYLRNPFRIIVDVAADTISLIPAPNGTTKALDMSKSITRAVAPVHIEYLKNMKVGASMWISIIVEGRLWGLFACHNQTAKLPGFAMRTAAELFGHMYSMTLESRLRGNASHDEIYARDLSDRLITGLAADETLLANADWIRDFISGMIKCDGIAVYQHDNISLSGSTPDRAQVLELARHLDAASPSRIFDTSQLATVAPSCEATQNCAAGMLSIPISRVPRDYIMLFRRELVEEVRWGGNPTKAAIPSEDGLRLSPRKSFASYAQLVRGKARPFSDQDRRIGEAVRLAIIEVILRYSDTAGEERRRATERNELLVAELNHRVRNILTLIRGLISKSGHDAPAVKDYVTSLNGRVQALARAHDYVTQRMWGPAALHSLIEDEIAVHRHQARAPLAIKGPNIMLQPQAISTMALVIHELATNSAKYGALSTDGEVHVTLRLDEKNGLYIEWRDVNG